MTTNGINVNKFNPDNFKTENLSGKSDKQVKEIIINFCNAAGEYASHVWDDGELEMDGSTDSNTEENILYRCMKKIDEIFGSSSNAVKTHAQKLKNTFVALAEAVLNNRYSGNNITYEDGEVTLNSSEPEETDFQQFKPKYGYLDNQADNMLNNEIKLSQQRIDSEKAQAFNPYYVSNTTTISLGVIESIKNLYKNNIIQDGYGVKKFTDVDKIQQLLNWASEQLTHGKISEEEFYLLTKEAVLALDELISKPQANQSNPEASSAQAMAERAYNNYMENYQGQENDDIIVQKANEPISDDKLRAAHPKVFTKDFGDDMMEVVNPGYKARKRAEQAKK